MHLDADGYVLLSRAHGRLLEHVAVAEAALGRKLPDEAIVHHVDENKKNNENTNLVICPNRAYHNLLHQRMRALAVSGHADHRKCVRCHKYDSLDKLSISGPQAFHPSCNAAHVMKMKGRKC